MSKDILAKEIYDLRHENKIKSAIERCEFATKEYPDENIFYKILGDLYIQNKDWKSAKNAYINQLKHLDNNTEYFKHFARFYYKYKKEASEYEIDLLNKELIELNKSGALSERVHKLLVSNLFPELSSQKVVLELINQNSNDNCLNRIKMQMSSIEDESDIDALVNYMIKNTNNKNRETYVFFASFAERHKMYKESIELLLIANKKTDKANPTVIRAIFRICRMIHDYSEAEKVFKVDKKFIELSDFNIQYELVYYLDTIGNSELLDLVLKKCVKVLIIVFQ